MLPENAPVGVLVAEGLRIEIPCFRALAPSLVERVTSCTSSFVSDRKQRGDAGTRPGFFLGDGAGVGKGRQISGLIKDFWAAGGRRVSVQCIYNPYQLSCRRYLPAFLQGADVIAAKCVYLALSLP